MEESIIAPEAELNAPQEGSLEAAVNTEAEAKEETTTQEPKVVPEAAFLALKKELKEIKQEMKEAKGSAQTKIEVQGYNELTQKYPDVSPEFIQDMLGAATKEAQSKIEAKYSPIIEKQEIEKKEAAFNKAFDNLFEKTLQENPDLPKNIDKELIKELALTPKYRNVPLNDILVKMYASEPKGKASSENEIRSAADVVSDVVDFGSITNEQKKSIMEDPKARSKYFDWLDTQTGR